MTRHEDEENRQMDMPSPPGATVSIYVRQKSRAAALSILASAGITLAKGLAGVTTGSLALISDALHSLLDVASTTATYLVVKAADRPPDETHHFGHGKIEALAALVQTTLLFLLSGAVAYEGLRRLWTGVTDVQPSATAIAVLVVAIVVDAWRWRSLRRIGRETGSEALAADALHFSADLVNSLLILAAFGLVALGYKRADALVAIGVSLFIAMTGFRLLAGTIATLTDAAPAQAASILGGVIGKVAGVVSVEAVRLRPVGGRFLGEAVVSVSRTQPLERVAAIKTAVASAIAAAVPNATLTIVATPVALDDESIMERLQVIAARMKLPVHHVTVQHVGKRIAIGCDIECDGRMPLGEAHAIASRYETEVKAEIGGDVEIETHIEPLELNEFAGKEANASVRVQVDEVLAELAATGGAIIDIHNVRVRDTDCGIVVNYHCRAESGLDVATVHQHVDDIEQGLKARISNVRRVVSHAEPVVRFAS